MSEGERDIAKYIEERDFLLRQTTGFAERFSTAIFEVLGDDQAIEAITRVKYAGMGRPYHVVDTLFVNKEASLRVEIVNYLLSPHRKHRLGFFDPDYEIRVESTEHDPKVSHQPHIDMRLMGNGEVDLYASSDGYNQAKINSWKLESNRSFCDKISKNPIYRETFEVLGLDTGLLQAQQEDYF